MGKDNGGPAFPNAGGHKFTSGNDVRVTLPHPGMTMRDYFAAKVCAAMVSTIRSDEDYFRASEVASRQGHAGLSEWFASDAYKQADAMLAERAK